MTNVLAPRAEESIAAQEAARAAYAAAFEAWVATMPKTTLADYHELQPTEDASKEAQDRFDEADFSFVTAAGCFVSIAWASRRDDDDYEVWGYDDCFNEVLHGVYSGDTPVFAPGY